MAVNLVAGEKDPVRECFRTRRAPRDVDINRHELVRRDECLVVEHSSRGAAGTHGNRPLGVEHLVIYSLRMTGAILIETRPDSMIRSA